MRRLRALDAGAGSGKAVERARIRVLDTTTYGCPYEQRAQVELRGTCFGSGEARRAEKRAAHPQEAGRVALHRQRPNQLRPGTSLHRKSDLRDGRENRWNGVRVDRAPAGVRRKGEELRRAG